MSKGVKKPNKILESIKKGLNDIKVVAEEGNFKLFLKQAVVIVIVFLGFRYYSQNLQKQDTKIHGQIEAVRTQQKSEKEYLANKEKLLKLEPRFPDMEAKNDWLLSQIVAVSRDSGITPSLGSEQSENTTNAGYTVVSIPMSATLTYNQLGQLLANIENREEYLKVSEFSLKKNNEILGENEVSMTINTIFPKEKVAKSLFKDAKKDTKKGGKK
ncbi:MAG: hypothetical protein IKL48_01465 [Elusimicrobiaceae bacterium]|nr:hypothetical protein [Elusimicrobiaceae bacterium]